MNQLQEFHHTVGVLVSAYLGDTLIAGSCTACAVGNICAAAVNDKISLYEDGNPYRESGKSPNWQKAFSTNYSSKASCMVQYFGIAELANAGKTKLAQKYSELAMADIAPTGYTPKELARVEYAFECACRIAGSPKRNVLAGLEAVIDVLADIHDVDLSVADGYKASCRNPLLPCPVA